jgi:parallel beta-helix repeat protein
MRGGGNNIKKIIGIFIVCLLFVVNIIPVMSRSIKDENKNYGEFLSNTVIKPYVLSYYRNNIFAISVEFSFSHLSYMGHEPIYINGNENFNEENGVSTGKGTVEDPYVIEGWEIKCDIRDGIVIRNTSIYFIIKNCYIHNGEMNKDGIVFYNVTNGIIDYNIITRNRNGVMFRAQYPGKENSNDNIISKNSIIYNINDGIHFEHTGNGWHSTNSILSNNIFGNTRGIYMVMSTENQILFNNIISNDEYGIQLDMCMGGGELNIIHHNNFFDNKGDEGQVCEWGDPINYWYDSYPYGGNFWNDYAGNDIYHGPNQDIQGSDGIGDLPYDIQGGKNQDKYPLMEPWNISNNPPNKPNKPSGLISGKTGIAYEYSSSAIDPDGDMVYLLFDWGDKTSDMVGPCNSGDIMIISHKWISVGTYSVKVKATDYTYFAESEWSDPLVVSMPKTHIYNPIIQLLFKLLSRFPFFEKILKQIQ